MHQLCEVRKLCAPTRDHATFCSQCFCYIAAVRFSYGPPMTNLEKGVHQMERMIQHWKENSLSVSAYEKESFGKE